VRAAADDSHASSRDADSHGVSTAMSNGEQLEEEATRDGDVDSGDGDVNVHIQRVKRKREWLQQLQSRKGLKTSATGSTIIVPTSNTVIADPLAAILGTNSAEPIESDPSVSILQQKQEKAMQEYVQTHLSASLQQDTNSERAVSTATSKNDLFAELAQMVGQGESDSSRIDSAVHSDDNDRIGAGGLVDGTGIAEVILPVDVRLQSMQKTVTVKADRGMVAPGRGNGSAPSRFQLYGARSRYNDDSGAVAPPPSQTAAPDTDRPGFAATRGHSNVGSNLSAGRGGRGGRSATNDDRMYARFVQNQRDQMMKR
jgi:hypothetical protein